MTGCFSHHNEDLAIVKLQPPVHKMDFGELESALRSFFLDIHQVLVAEVQPCPLGDAYVQFNTALERERFLGPTFKFGSYDMTLVKHDEANNARTFNLDHEAWVVLVGFPKDLKCTSIIARVVSRFGILAYWHETSNLACLVAKVYLNDNAKILESIKINAGLPQKGKSWTSPCYVLKNNVVTAPQDEEGYVTTGPLHPIPPSPPHWLGLDLTASSGSSPTAPGSGNAMNLDVDGHSRWPQQSAPQDLAQITAPTPQANPPQGTETLNMPKLKSVIVGSTSREDPLVAFDPSLLNQVTQSIPPRPSPNFLRNLDSLFIDHDTQIPCYFNDKNLLIHLAFRMYPQLRDNALEKISIDYMDSEENEMEVEEIEKEVGIEEAAAGMEEAPFEDPPADDIEEEIQILDDPPAIFMTPINKKKKKSGKLK